MAYKEYREMKVMNQVDTSTNGHQALSLRESGSQNLGLISESQLR